MALERNPFEDEMGDGSPPPAAPSFWSDAGKALGAGATELGAQAVGAFADSADAPRDSVPRQTQDALNEVTRTITESISPSGRRDLEAEAFPTEDKQSLFQRPMRSLGMKLAKMAPQLAGLALMPSGGVGVLAASAAGGVQSLAQTLNDTRVAVNALPDDELQKRSSEYRRMRLEGMPEGDAREALTDMQNSAANLTLSTLGGLASGGAMGHALKGRAAKGLVRSVGVGALDTGAGMGVMGGASETGRELGEMATGQREKLTPEMILLGAGNAAVEGTLLGGAFGAAAGMRRRGVTPKGKDEAVVPPLTKEEIEGHPLPPDQAAGMETTKDNRATPTAEQILADVEAFRQQAHDPAVTNPPQEGPLDRALRERAAQDAVVPPPPAEPAPVAPPDLPRGPDAPVMVLPEPARAAEPKPLTAEEITAAAPAHEVALDAATAKSLDALLEAPEKPAASQPLPKTGTLKLAKPPAVTPEGNAKPRVLKQTSGTPEELARIALNEAATKAANDKIAQTAKVEAGAPARTANADRMAAQRKAKAEGNEGRAERIFKETTPDEHQVPMEDAILKGEPTKVAAYERLDEQARVALEQAEADGVVVQRQTTSRLAPGDKNLTPHVNRLRSMKRYRELYARLKAVPEGNKTEGAGKVRENFDTYAKDYVAEGRLLREGKDSSGPRVERNSEITRKYERRKEKGLDHVAAKEEGPSTEDLPSRRLLEEIGPEAPGEDRSTTVRDELGVIHRDLERMAPNTPSAGLYATVVKRLIETAGDTPLNFVSRERFDKLLGRDTKTDDIQGFFRSYNEGVTSEGKRGAIYIPHDQISSKPLDAVRLTVHEVVHAATKHAIDQNPRFAAELTSIHKAVINHLYGAVSRGAMTADEHAKWLAEYGLRAEHADGRPDVREFVAEALANPRLQKLLMQVTAPPELWRRYGVDRGKTMWGMLVDRIASALGFVKSEISALDATLRISEHLMDYKPPVLHNAPVAKLDHNLSMGVPSRAAVFRRLEDHLGTAGTWRHRIQRAGYHVLTSSQLAAAHASHWKSDVTTALGDVLKRMGAEKDRIISATDKPLVDKLAHMERKYHGEKWDQFAELAYDSTVSQLDPRKPPKARDPNKAAPMADWQARAIHQRLHDAYTKLPADLKEAFDAAVGYHKARQDELNLGHLEEIVKHVNGGVPNPTLARKIFDNKLSDSEKDVISGDAALKAILESKKLSKIRGVYFSLMRHGNYVVSGRHQFDTPMDANGPAERFTSEGNPADDGHILQFKSRAAAEKFAGETPLHINNIQHVFTDKDGNRWVVDADGTKVKMTKEDFGAGTAEERYRITVQDKHVEFHDSEHDALRAKAAMEAQGIKAAGVEVKDWYPDGRGAKMMHDGFETVANSLRQRKSFQELPEEQRNVLLAQLHDSAIMALGSTRAQSRALPRTNVAGYSKDLVRNVSLYSSQTAGYLARTRYQSRVNDAIKGMDEEMHARRYESGEGPTIRSQHLNAMKQRVYGITQPERHGFWYGVGSRLLQLSYLDKLASPAFHIINSMEPWTVGAPLISGRHGWGKTVAAMHRAYADIGYLGTLAAGAKDTVTAARDPYRLTSYLQRFSDRVKGEDKLVLKDLAETGLLSRDAGLELAHYSTPEANILGRGLDRADLMARQMGTAIESINRAVLGLSSYRLERERGGSHEEGLAYARKVVDNSMGDYSAGNAAPIFNHPVGRLALQFKKYAQKTYYLLGSQAYAAFRGDKEAMKTFGSLMLTHATLAGVLGLPLEAIKAGMMAANMTGATDDNYGDVEQWVRKVAARNLGPAGGEILSRGLPRYLGVDLSSRVGLDSLLLGMPPRGNKADDIFAYAGKTLAGAPASLVVEWAEGAQAFAKGDYLTAGQKWLPLKVFADSLTAAQRYSEGRKSKTGRETMSAYTPAEAATRAMGFTPGREAETMEMRGAIGGDQKRYSEERKSLMQGWVTAPADNRAHAWGEIQRWNKDQPKDAQIGLGELTKALQTRKKEEGKADRAGGVVTTKRDRHLREQMGYYNAQ